MLKIEANSTVNKSNLNDTNSKKKGIYLSSIAIFLFVSYIFSQRWLDLILQSTGLQVAILAIVLAFLLLKPTNNRILIFSYTRIDLLWTCAIIVVLIYILSVEISNYDIQLFMYITGILFLILAKVHIDRYETSFKLIKVASVIYALATVFHYLFTDIFHTLIFPLVPYSVKERTIELVNLSYYPGFGFAQPAVAAGYMIIGIGIILASFEFKSLPEKRIAILLLLLLSISILMVGKRSILIWGILAALVTYYFSASRKEKIGRMIKLSIGFLTGSTLLFLTINYFDSVPMFTRIIDTFNGLRDGEDVTAGRIILYTGAWELFKENPVFGIGWEQFVIVTSGWFFSRDLSVHNVYLQLLTETGLVGFMAIIIPLVYVYFQTFKTLNFVAKNKEKYKKWKVGLTFSLYFQTFFLLYCMTENPFYSIVFMFMYFFCVSIVNSFMIFELSKGRSTGSQNHK